MTHESPATAHCDPSEQSSLCRVHCPSMHLDPTAQSPSALQETAGRRRPLGSHRGVGLPVGKGAPEAASPESRRPARVERAWPSVAASSAEEGVGHASAGRRGVGDRAAPVIAGPRRTDTHGARGHPARQLAHLAAGQPDTEQSGFGAGLLRAGCSYTARGCTCSRPRSRCPCCTTTVRTCSSRSGRGNRSNLARCRRCSRSGSSRWDNRPAPRRRRKEPGRAANASWPHRFSSSPSELARVIRKL